MSENSNEAEVVENVDQTVVEQPVAKPEKSTRVKTPNIRDGNDAILELRKENENLRKRLDEISEAKAQELAEARIAQAKDEAKAEAERLLNERLAEMEQASRARVTKTELKAQAIRAGVVDFDDLFDIMRRTHLSKVEFSDDGEVMNAAELIAEVKESKPHLFAAVNTSSPNAVPKESKVKVEGKKATEMTPEEYRRARAKLVQM